MGEKVKLALLFCDWHHPPNVELIIINQSVIGK